MIIVEISALENGAHRNQTMDFPPDVELQIPEGWAVVPEELEGDYQAAVPFFELTVEDGVVTAITPTPRPQPQPQPEPEPQPDELTMTQLAVAELATVVEENNTANQLAIAELAEALLGGEG